MTATSLPSEPEFDPRAQELYFAFCERVERGEKPDFEALCAAHPAHERDLREMHSLHEFARCLAGRAAEEGVANSLLDELRQHFGDSLASNPGLDAESASRWELFERLQGDGPRDKRYRLLGKVAEGGMGAILRVWDEELRRTLAMKVVLGKSGVASGETPAVDPKTLGRFLEEAQITGQLDHPGIVPVHELGLDAAGRVYFTMKLVKGEDLKAVFEHVHAGHKDWNQVRALNVMLRVCEAVAFAHSKNVVHRDLKPANVMVGKFGEVYVMDWGLARVLGREDKHDLRLRPENATTASVVRTERREQRDSTPDSPLVTMDGDVVGTPSYMPPEQARGQLDKLGPHSDVYSIGAMLYQLVTGRLPYVPAEGRVSQHTILAAVLRGPPESVESLAPRTPPELVAIVEKAMEREIAARYPTTMALADDLRAYLDGRVVAAYEAGTWAETRKWVQRNRPLAASLAAAVLALLGGVAFSVNFARDTEAANVALRAASRKDRLSGMIQDLARLRAQSRTLDGLDQLGKPAYLWWIEESEKLLNGQEEDLTRDIEWRPGLKDVQAKLAELDASSSRDSAAEWLRSQLATLETNLLWQARMLAVANEAAFSDKAKARWAEAIEGIATAPKYAGQKWASGERLTQQLGLLPLGENPATGLWEFVHLQTGTEPALGPDGRVLRDAEGRLTLTPETGMVFVLLPGGRVPKSTVNDGQEQWITEVDLDPFFLSKYEMTHEQWDRVSLRRGFHFRGETPLVPATFISWEYVTLMLQRELGWCGFPSEAQWEYGCRARTTSTWWPGDEEIGLEDVASLDALLPVGGRRANDFGLHDVHGNVWEWCGDTYTARLRPRDRDGLREDGVEDSAGRVRRGGSWSHSASNARSAHRLGNTPGIRYDGLGVRPARRITP